MSRVTALIADDESLARRRIRSLLSRHPEVEVVGEAEDGRRTLQMVRSLQPALMFLDIQMPELNGFEVLEELPAKITPEVIFVTAYDRFALRAFEVHALDYLLKPFTRARFARAVDHCLERLRESPGVPDPHLLSLRGQGKRPAKVMRSAEAFSFPPQVDGEGCLPPTATVQVESVVSQVTENDHQEQRAEGVPKPVTFHSRSPVLCRL